MDEEAAVREDVQAHAPVAREVQGSAFSKVAQVQ